MMKITLFNSFIKKHSYTPLKCLSFKICRIKIRNISKTVISRSFINNIPMKTNNGDGFSNSIFIFRSFSSASSASAYSTSAITTKEKDANNFNLKDFLRDGIEPNEKDYNNNNCENNTPNNNNNNDGLLNFHKSDDEPYFLPDSDSNHGRKVFIETYGCQMNSNDTDVVYSILKNAGYEIAPEISQSDVTLLMTCSIREGAEQKIWKRVQYLGHLKKLKTKSNNDFKIGILGCMAERLKNKILESNESIDLICGPDAYRSLPKLLSQVKSGQTAANTLLSLDETYADIQPIKRDPNSVTAFVSIMRGCNNMCTYCVVPFVRGRERSRPLLSIVDEVKRLIDQGVKDITLLGQNVNSYCDKTAPKTFSSLSTTTTPRAGFKTVYKQTSSQSNGFYSFVDLLDRISLVDKEVRIRFTSPHPKDFPNEVIQLIQSRRNICRQLHVPAQSGSDRVLERMGRGYNMESYMGLVDDIKTALPDVSLSSDFIAGFCGETMEDHELTLKLMQDVRYNRAFCFPYSMREKTRAYHRLIDDVPKEVKLERASQLVDCYRRNADLLNRSLIGSKQLVLVEGLSKRNCDEFYGRNDANIKVIFNKYFKATPSNYANYNGVGGVYEPGQPISIGDYVIVTISSSSSQVLKGEAISRTTLGEFYGFT